MGDRELPVANRTVHKRWLRYTASLHEDAKLTTRTTIPSTPPPTYDFLSTRSKRNQVFLERTSTIERENLILLEKMRHIMTERQMNLQEPFLKESLNRGQRKQEMVRIMTENEALLRRIQTRRPVYQVEEFEQQHAKKEYLLSRVGKYPYVSESMPNMTPPPLSNSKLKYYGYAGRQAIQASKRPGATVSLLPRISGTQTYQSQSARKPGQYPSASATSSSTSTSSQPTTSRTPGRKTGRNLKALVFTGEVEVEGVPIQLSVYEKSEQREHSAGLEFIGVDTAKSTSSALPAFYSFQSLATAFAAKKKAADEDEQKEEAPSSLSSSSSAIPLDYFNNPTHTRDLIQALLPKLTWQPSEKNDGLRHLILKGVDQELTKVNRAPPPTEKGELVYAKIGITTRGLPKDKTTVNPPIAVVYAMNPDSGAYQQVAFTTLVQSGSGSSSSDPIQFKGTVIVPHYEFLDNPLRMGFFEVDAAKNLIPTSCLGESRWMIQQMVELASGKELKLRLVKNGKPLPLVKGEPEPIVLLTHERTTREESEAVLTKSASSTKISSSTASPSSSKKDLEESKEATAPPPSTKKVPKTKSHEKEKEKEKPAAAVATAATPVTKTEVVKKIAAAAAKPAALTTEDDDDEDDTSSTKVKKPAKLWQGGRNFQGVDVLVRIVDSAEMPPAQRPTTKGYEPDAILYHLYYRPTSLVFDHAIAKSALPELLAQLAKPCDSTLLPDQVEALLELFTATSLDDGKKVEIKFKNAPLVPWKNLKSIAASSVTSSPASSSPTASRSSSTSKLTPATPVKSSPKTSPRASMEKPTPVKKQSSAVSSTPAKDKRASTEESTKEKAPVLKQVEKPSETTKKPEEKKPLVDGSASVDAKVAAFEKAADAEKSSAAADKEKTPAKKTIKTTKSSAEEGEKSMEKKEEEATTKTPAKKKSSEESLASPKADKRKSTETPAAKDKKEDLTRTPSKKEKTIKIDDKPPVAAEDNTSPDIEEKMPEKSKEKTSSTSSKDKKPLSGKTSGLIVEDDATGDLDPISSPSSKSSKKDDTLPIVADAAKAEEPKKEAAAKATPAKKKEETKKSEAKKSAPPSPKADAKPEVAASSDDKQTAVAEDVKKTPSTKPKSKPSSASAKKAGGTLDDDLNVDLGEFDEDFTDEKPAAAASKPKPAETKSEDAAEAEAEATKKKAEEEAAAAAAKKKLEEEEAAAAAKKKADEATAAAAAAKKKSDEEAKIKKAKEVKAKKDKEAAEKKAAEAKAKAAKVAEAEKAEEEQKKEEATPAALAAEEAPKSDDADAAAAAAKQKADDEAAAAAAAAEAEAKKKAAEEEAAAAAKKKADEEAAAAAAEKKADDEKKKADEEAAAKKKKAEEEEEEAKKKAEKEKAEKEKAEAEAAAKKKKAEQEAAAAAKKKKEAEEAAAAAAAAKKAEEDAKAEAAKAEAEAAAKKAAEAAELEAKQEERRKKKAAKAEQEKAKFEADAKAALAKGPTPITLTMKVSCKALPTPKTHPDLSPMVAMYAEGANGQYSFISQTDRKDKTNQPQFDTPIIYETDANTPTAALMFSIYHVVEGVALSEDDMIGQALSTQGDLQLALKNGKPLEIPIQANGEIVPHAFITLSQITQSAGHAAKAGEQPKETYEVYVACRRLQRVDASGAPAVVSPMVALYAADAEGEFAYVQQTERLDDQTDPVFDTPIRIEASPHQDQHLMFSIYHVNEGAEISADDQIGAATTTMVTLLAATESKPLRLTISKDEVDLPDATITAFVKKI